MARNDGFTYRERLLAGASGETLLDYLVRRYSHSTRGEWTIRIEAGDVRLDAKLASPGTSLRGGQEIVWRRPAWDEPAAPLEFELLHEDDDLLAVAKPAGLPTLPGAGFLESTLLHQVRKQRPDATAIHRLGRWTSGVVLFARNGSARAELSRQLRAREIEKRYRASACGDPPWTAITIDHPIGPVPHPKLGSVYGAAENGKPSVSHVEVLERRADSFLCDVRIATGRPHQIRIHLAALGHPLVGDPLYVAGGVPAVGTRAVPGDPGYLLHAAETTLHHPRTGELLVMTSEPPPGLTYDGELGSALPSL